MDQLTYDVFLSYARVDDESNQADDENNQFVSKLAKEMERAFQSSTGRPLRIFLDTREISTAQVWEERIKGALENSTVMVAVLTPSYFHSKWCGREWDYFRHHEERRRREIRLPAFEALIFPVLFISLNNILRPTEEAQRRISEAMSREYKGLVDVRPESPRFQIAVRELVSEIARLFMRLDDLAAAGTDVDPSAVRPPALRAWPSSGPRLTTRMGNEEDFIQSLSEAKQVTVLGITNERLGTFLNEALKRKRRREGTQAFWSSIRVVFASESMLHLIHDDLNAKFPNDEDALRVRFQRAGQGRRAVASFFLLSNHPPRWTMYEYPHLLPFVGALFEMPDGSKVAQVATFRPSYRVAEYLFIEFAEMAGEVAYYQAAFEDVVQSSESEDEVTLAGRPKEPGPGFECLGSRFRRSVMLPNRGTPSDWLPAILVCTYWDRPGLPELLMQIRTPENSSHEVGVLSHISGLINERDSPESELAGKTRFLLPEEAARRAAMRELREEMGFTHSLELVLVDQIRFHAISHESLYFYLFVLPVPPDIGNFPEASQVHPWSISELLQLRRHQALVYAEEVLGRRTLSIRQADLAGRIVRLNLLLHDLGELGETLNQHVYRREGDPDLMEEIRRLKQESEFLHPAGEGGLIWGLGRLQYRHFFSVLLPLYERVGISGAKEELAKIATSPHKRTVVEELSRLYSNETVMRDLPMEV